MSVVENLLSAADPAGVALYTTVMAFLLGTVAFARLWDDLVSARKARRWTLPK
jgi:hypothetical protein